MIVHSRVLTREGATSFRTFRSTLTCAVAIGVTVVATVVAADTPKSDKAASPHFPILFSAPLADIPGKRLVVVPVTYPPRQPGQQQSTGHRHPGSVYVYVTKGTARLGLKGQPVQEVHAGESFFEPVGAVHTVGESASSTEPVSLIAVMIVPEDAPTVTVLPE